MLRGGPILKSLTAKYSGIMSSAVDEAPMNKTSHPCRKKRRLEEHSEGMSSAKSTMPLVVFAHGAGAGASSPFMVHWQEMLSTTLVTPVHTFDFPNMTEGKRGPPPSMPKLVRSFGQALDAACQAHPAAASHGIVLAGKSMGSRVALYFAESPESKDLNILGCVAFGYPIGNDKERTDLAERASIPVLFVHGSRDKTASFARLAGVVERASASELELSKRKSLYRVENGDHSLAVTKTWLKSKGTSQQEIDVAALDSVASFIRALGQQE